MDVEVTHMQHEDVYCPLLKKPLSSPLCLSITYAAEGRISPDEVAVAVDWDQARHICADCVNAYWNRNNLEPPRILYEEE
jgi:DNA-binding transcriptional regulator YdaS (Cro superfamily)